MPKVREAIKLIEADGWRKVTTKGSHRQFKHPMKTGRVTIAGRLSDDLAPGTYTSRTALRAPSPRRQRAAWFRSRRRRWGCSLRP